MYVADFLHMYRNWKWTRHPLRPLLFRKVGSNTAGWHVAPAQRVLPKKTNSKVTTSIAIVIRSLRRTCTPPQSLTWSSAHSLVDSPICIACSDLHVELSFKLVESLKGPT